MKHFTIMQLEEAYAYAEAGGQALYTHNVITDKFRTPICLVRAVRTGRNIAHLFDRDEDRLMLTARLLGAHVKVEARNTYRQHINLCAAPLRRALERCQKDDRNSSMAAGGDYFRAEMEDGG